MGRVTAFGLINDTGRRVRFVLDRTLAEAERLYLRELTATADMAEAIQAFVDKRPPVWRHR